MYNFVSLINKIFFTQILALVFMSSSLSASFNCNQANGYVEKTICQNNEVSDQDSYMSLLYSQLKDGLSSVESESLMRKQTQWINERNQCKTISCLLQTYSKRIDELKAMSPSMSIKSQNLQGSWLADYSNQYQSSKLEISAVDSKGFKYSILALNGAHDGQIDSGWAKFIDNDAISIENEDSSDQSELSCQVLFRFIGNQLKIKENGACPTASGVTFNGSYQKDGKAKFLTLHDVGLLDSVTQEEEFKKIAQKSYSLFTSLCGFNSMEEKSTDPTAIIRYGQLRGLGMQCIIMSDGKKFWAAVIDVKDVKYITNDERFKKDYPPTILNWIKKQK